MNKNAKVKEGPEIKRLILHFNIDKTIVMKENSNFRNVEFTVIIYSNSNHLILLICRNLFLCLSTLILTLTLTFVFQTLSTKSINNSFYLININISLIFKYQPLSSTSYKYLALLFISINLALSFIYNTLFSLSTILKILFISFFLRDRL